MLAALKNPRVNVARFRSAQWQNVERRNRSGDFRGGTALLTVAILWHIKGAEQSPAANLRRQCNCGRAVLN